MWFDTGGDLVFQEMSYKKGSPRLDSGVRYQHERARLNLIRHLLSLVPYKEAPREEVKLPKRKVTVAPVPAERVVFVPEQY